MKLRDATYEDIDWTIEQLGSFADKLGCRDRYMPDDEILRRALAKMADAHVYIVAEDEGKPVGMVCGEYVMHPYNQELRTLVEHFWHVDPDHRGKGVGSQLLQVFMQIGKETADTISFNTNLMTNVPDGYLEKHGLSFFGKAYLWEK